jgi:hypothetical protein
LRLRLRRLSGAGRGGKGREIDRGDLPCHDMIVSRTCEASMMDQFDIGKTSPAASSFSICLLERFVGAMRDRKMHMCTQQDYQCSISEGGNAG